MGNRSRETTLATIRRQIEGGQFQAAMRLCRAVLREHGTDAQIWVHLAECLEKTGSKDDAWLAYDRAWLLDPGADWVDAVRERLRPRGKAPSKDWLRTLLSVPEVTVAAAMIVRNEARTLRQALMALRPAVDEIIVVDTGSEDRSIQIAKECGARIYMYEWNEDFGAARNFALSKVTAQWALWVDADEVLDEGDIAAVKTVAGIYQESDPPAILRIVQVNTTAGGAQMPVYDMSRFHPTQHGMRFWGRIHEQIGPPEGGLMGGNYPRPAVRIRVHHDGYKPEIMQSKDKLRRNAFLLGQTVEEQPDDVAAWGFLGRELFLLGELDVSITALQRAEQLAADQPLYARLPEVRMFLTEALTARDRLAEALAVAERAVRDQPNFPAAHYALGRVQLKTSVEMLRQAYQNFIAAVQTAGSYRGMVSYDSDIPRWKAPLAAADAAKLLGNWVEAMSLYEQMLTIPSADKAAIEAQVQHMTGQLDILRARVGEAPGREGETIAAAK